MARVRISAVLGLTIVIHLTNIGAKPQSELDHIGQIQTQDSSHPGTDSYHTVDREGGIVPPRTATSTPDTTSRLRRGVTKPQNGYKPTPNVGIHLIHRHAERWHEARKICQAEGGDLAVINSKAKSQALAELIAKSYPHYGSDSSNWVFIGFEYLDQKGKYVTIDGSSLKDAGFAEWAPGNPNNLGGPENCGSISADGRLNDIACEQNYAFACELPMLGQVVPLFPTGPQGIPGVKGEAEVPDPVGSAGQKGEPGAKGKSGPLGPRGIRGDKGVSGSAGVKGQMGSRGPAGSPGLTGPPGPNGAQGSSGMKGDAGSSGAAGLDGRKGEPGARGNNGLRGAPGEKGGRGQSGPLGPRGIRGDKGISGSAGMKGERGSQGPPGSPGLTGPPGPNGAQGSPGMKGDAGSSGAVGLDGRKGEPGERGNDGLPGAASQKGERGDSGRPGPQGSTGPPGQAGDRGPSRPAGPKGNLGAPGPQGPKGETGVGERGPPGPAGSRGEPGLSYDDGCLAVLSILEQNQADALIDRGDVPISTGNAEPHAKCKEFVAKAYELMGVRTFSPDSEPPAKTCKDLFVAYSDKPSGEYLIDPNEGDVSDAILVHCDAEKRATCVTPGLSRSPKLSYIGHKPEVWLSEIDDKLQITYTAGANQLTALQLFSSHAEQNVTYHCLKSVGYFDTETKSYDRGLKLLAWNDVELQPRGSHHFRYDVKSDGCKDRLDEWKETVITYRTNQPARLPVLDVGLRDVGNLDQQFFVEIGEVCFT